MFKPLEFGTLEFVKISIFEFDIYTFPHWFLNFLVSCSFTSYVCGSIITP